MGDKLQWEARGSGVPPINIITIKTKMNYTIQKLEQC